MKLDAKSGTAKQNRLKQLFGHFFECHMHTSGLFFDNLTRLHWFPLKKSSLFNLQK